MNISTKDGVVPKIVPRYSRLIAKDDGETRVTVNSKLTLTSSGRYVFKFHERSDNGYGEYKSVGTSKFKPVSGFCIAGYYIWGTGIEMKEIKTSGSTNSLIGHSLSFNINQYSLFSTSAAPESTKAITVSTKAISDTGKCSNGLYNDKEGCLSVIGQSWVQEGIFQKMLYFDAGEEITTSRVQLEHTTSGTPVAFITPSDKMKTGEYANSKSEIVMELAHILDYKPDLPDSLALLRVASTGKGSKKETVENSEDEFFGLLEDESVLSSTKERAIGIDTRGQDMDYVADKGKDSDSTLRKKQSEPFDIWQEYNTYGYIPNIMGALELPDKMAKGFNKDSDFTLANLTANASSGGDPFSNKSLPINFNPVYDAGRKLIHDNLRMAPRNALVDYRVEANCPYCANEYYTTEAACGAAGYVWGGKYVRDKSVLTFERFANGVSDAGNPKMGGLNKETTDTVVYNPMAVKPRNTED
jgi:hypothetical protein